MFNEINTDKNTIITGYFVCYKKRENSHQIVGERKEGLTFEMSHEQWVGFEQVEMGGEDSLCGVGAAHSWA